MDQGVAGPKWELIKKKPRMMTIRVLIKGTAPLIAPVWRKEIIPLIKSSPEEPGDTWLAEDNTLHPGKAGSDG